MDIKTFCYFDRSKNAILIKFFKVNFTIRHYYVDCANVNNYNLNVHFIYNIQFDEILIK